MLLVSILDYEPAEPVTGLISETTDSPPKIFFFEFDLRLSLTLDSLPSLLLDRSSRLNFILLLPLKLLRFISTLPLKVSSLQFTVTFTNLVISAFMSSKYFSLISTEPKFWPSLDPSYFGLRGGSFRSSMSAGM